MTLGIDWNLAGNWLESELRNERENGSSQALAQGIALKSKITKSARLLVILEFGVD